MVQELKDKKIVAVLLARGGSKRIPKKNIIDLCGKPLLAWPIEAAKASEYISEVYVSTDDQEISGVAQKYGAKVIDRPAELAVDTATSESALLHFAAQVDFDILVFIQPTTPLVSTDDIDKAINMMKNYDSVFTAMESDWLVWFDNKPTYDLKNRKRSQDFDSKTYLENGAVFVTTRENLLKDKCRLSGNIGICEVSKIRSMDIDCFEDLEIVRTLLTHELNKKILKGKNCLITGASGGIGREIARVLALRGCNLILTGQSLEKLIQVKREVEELGSQIKVGVIPADLSKTEDTNRIIAETKEKFNQIDILINNAGVFPNYSKIIDTSLEDFDKCFDVNVRAPYILSKELGREMARRRWGRIVNIGSSSAYAGFPETGIYCASKHALLGLSRSMFNELKADGVRVFSVSPGSVKTELGRLVKGQDFETFIDPKELAEYIAQIITFDDNMISEEVRLNRLFVQ